MITLREKKGEGRLLHILMGRARTGKSERVLQRIAALGDSSQQILLVPEHASHVAEMDLCRVCGDTASRHAEALTFKLLASRVLSICGGSADVTLDSGGKLLTLQRTLTELAPVLKVYKRPSQRAAFLESLLAVMEELQAYAVSPEQLSESVAQIEGESGDKLRDLSLIYSIYLSKLHAPGHDARDVLEKLEENLEASGYIDNKDIFLDGFSYFTGRELRILRILLRRAKSVTVTLLGDTQDRELFSESLRVRERLYALARDAGVACEEEILPQGEVRGALDHIERCFFGAADEFTQPTDTVALYEAGSAYSECEWVASQILKLVREQGYRYREITVTARDLDSYAGAIENVFARYGIPLYYAHRSDILKSPVLTLLLGALDAEEFASLMRLVLTQYSVGTIPVTLDAVNLCEMTRNDRHTVRALFLLGANDGVLPAAENRGGVLRDEDREALERQQIFLAPHGMEQFHLEIQNLYAALAQPTEKLTVSYPVSDGKGAEKRPSFVIGRIARLLPSISVETESADKEYRLSAKSTALEYAGEHIGGALWQYFEGQGDAERALAAMKDASRYTRGHLSRDAVHALYGGAVTLSASRMDMARSCHFAYFMRYGLKARERTGAGFDAPQIGTFVHDVMEHTLRQAKECGGLHTLSKDKLHALVRASIEEYIDRVLPDLCEKSARFRYLFNRLCATVERIMDEVSEELQSSDFEPLAFELEFGADGQLPAITIREENGTARVVGKVDREDGWLHDGKLYLRVVDYKTGKKSFDLAELRYGLGLQMLLYLFTLKEEGQMLFGGHEIVPAGVLYTPAREPMLRCARDTEPETIEKALKKELRRSGMVLEDPAVLQAMEHSALESPCYLPIAVKRDGAVTGSLASAEQLGKLSKYVDHILHEITQEVFAGNIDADPYARTPQQSACTYCEFASACHFENGCGSDRMEYIKATKNDEFWQYIDEVNGEGAHENG